MCSAERRSSLPAVRALQAASSGGLRSILRHTMGYCRKLTLYKMTKLRRGLQIGLQCSKNSAKAPPCSLDVYTDW
eukprot:2029095-Rhodomonas_salina.2